jgi:hypothetical protein
MVAITMSHDVQYIPWRNFQNTRLTVLKRRVWRSESEQHGLQVREVLVREVQADNQRCWTLAVQSSTKHQAKSIPTVHSMLGQVA